MSPTAFLRRLSRLTPEGESPPRSDGTALGGQLSLPLRQFLATESCGSGSATTCATSSVISRCPTCTRHTGSYDAETLAAERRASAATAGGPA